MASSTIRPHIDAPTFKPVSTPKPAPGYVPPAPRPYTSSAAVAWRGGSGLDASPAQTSGPRPQAPKPGLPPEANQARTDLLRKTYQQYMAQNFQRYRHLPPEDQAEIRAEAQRRGEGAVARFDQMFTEARAQARAQHHNLPPEDADAIALSSTEARMAANGGVALDPKASYVNQRDGFVATGSGNNNCGYASALAVMKYLGTPIPKPDDGVPAGNSETYHLVMMLRGMGGGGTTATTSSALDIEKALDAAGANATTIPSSEEWKKDHSLAVDWMKQQFMNQSNGGEAFIVGGQPGNDPQFQQNYQKYMAESSHLYPHLPEEDQADIRAEARKRAGGGGWPSYSDYDGAHWVAVVGYDPKSNTFTVLDPYPKEGEAGGPIQVTPEQLQRYMEADNNNGVDYSIQNNEIVVVRP